MNFTVLQWRHESISLEATSMRASWAILTLVLGPVLLPVPARSQEKFTPKNGMFTITLPAGEKKRQQTRILTIGRHKVPIEASGSTLKDGTSFQGASVGIPARVMREIPADKRFDILRDAILKGLKGKVAKEKDIKRDTIPGKEYQIETPRGAARVQLYTVAGFVVFGVVEGKKKEQVNSREADTFYGSLKFTDKAKEVFREVKR
jgi:hypothetical protein